jgi:hypothetical protein
LDFTLGPTAPDMRELQEYSTRLGVHDRDYARVRAAVTQQWNKMTNAVAIDLVRGAGPSTQSKNPSSSLLHTLYGIVYSLLKIEGEARVFLLEGRFDNQRIDHNLGQ